MTRIELKTTIVGDIEGVFDLSRDISFHMKSASQTKEKAVAGTTEGLIGLNETVSWKGKHFGLWLRHTSKIVQMDRPIVFVDLMIDGHFTYFVHKHLFEQTDEGVLMKDELLYKVPYGLLGRIFDKLILKNYLTRFLEHRNQMIKEAIETKVKTTYTGQVTAAYKQSHPLFI